MKTTLKTQIQTEEVTRWVRRMIDNLNHVQEYDIPLLALSLDAEKAFDREFLQADLAKFGFDDFASKSVKALYANPTAYIVSPDSKKFKIGNDTRQGCPLSPLLFILFIEPLTIYIRECRAIEGVTINGEEFKCMGFPDE